MTLASADLTTNLDPLAVPAEMGISLGFRAAYRLPDEHPNHIFVRVDQRFEVNAEDGGENLMLLEVGFDLIYRLESAATYPEDALKYFAELNGPYNAWPYLRECVQSIGARVGLGGIVIPVFRPERQEIQTEEQSRVAVEA
ncbi:MAG: hypothetical protein ACREMK_02030 [Gemmatimonadota bacterium]